MVAHAKIFASRVKEYNLGLKVGFQAPVILRSVECKALAKLFDKPFREFMGVSIPYVSTPLL